MSCRNGGCATVVLKLVSNRSGWKRWTELFSMQGYESQLVTLDPHPVPDSHSGTTEEMLAALEAGERLRMHPGSALADRCTRSDLSRLISSGGSPFPPVLFASSLSTLVAETYVSSHPLQGLFLHAPALPLALPSSSVSTLPTILKSDFTYEPNFPLAVMAHVQKELERGRLWDEFGEGEDEDDRLVEFIVGRRDDEGFEKALEWMDASGI